MLLEQRLRECPRCLARAEGAHLWDVDGNRYVDFLQAGGPTVLGSKYAPVRERTAGSVRVVSAHADG